MSSFRLALTALLIAACGIHSASALEVDDSANTKAGVNLSDPDDKIPFPHVTDDGSQPTANFQMQPVGNTGVSFGLTPNNANSGSDAFTRAQQNQMQ